MKTSLLFGFILFHALSVTIDAVKGGLSKDEQKKLVDEINKDRKKFNGNFKDLTYDTELEKEITEALCKKNYLIWLQWNSVHQDVFNSGGDSSPYVQFFDARVEKIGCSKEIRCSSTVGGGPKIPKELVGKEVISLGGCVLRPDLAPNKIDESLIPKGSKYGDLLGIMMSSSGRVFNLIVFLAIMVFYF
ncbi:hypothetical protein CRE_05873 [Caenorhabditis remanei]|uniref:Uncharacterized protein n=1 Tax=Caenorhabditis remanei TaxID=31234 RepID=E3MNI4_CAERE|nr:hypothetical protein CRE_05873 [Caenorhabditis remanei]